MALDVDELSGAARQAHRETVETSPRDMARFLQEVLGQKLVAYIANVSDPRSVARWVAVDNGRNPSTEAAERLSAAFYVFRLLSEAESPYVVRAWFAGLNPLLDEQSPATVMREGRFQDAVAAARAFVSDG